MPLVLVTNGTSELVVVKELVHVNAIAYFIGFVEFDSSVLYCYMKMITVLNERSFGN